MNAKIITGIDIILPTNNVVDAFLKIILPLRDRLNLNIKESNTLSGLRDTLLPKLLSGEVRIEL
jgi:type I restriction enzyme S subunit